MRVRVIRVGSIPFGLTVLIDQEPGSLVVWLLDSEWPEELAGRVEQLVAALYATQQPATAA